MHAIRFATFYREIIEGQFPVRWTSQFHFGYGTALFNFVYPLPYLVSFPFIAAGLSPVLTLKISFALTYLIAGFTMYLFASQYFRDKRVAFFVTILYQFAPFRLVEMNVRGNLGALYAYALAPLLIFSIIYFLKKKTYMSWLYIVIAVSLITLSHTIMGFAFLVISGAFIFVQTNRIKLIILTLAAFILGIALSSFFIFPAILEQKYTNGYLFTKDVFYHHFPSLKALLVPNFANIESLRVAEVAVQIGLFQVVSVVIAVIFVFTKSYTTNAKRMIGFLLLTTIGTILFMQPIAKPLWENVSLVRQFQHPWRFVGILVFTTALLGAYTVRDIQFLRKPIVFVILSSLVVFSSAFYWRPLQGFVTHDDAFYWEYPLTTNYFSEVNTIWMADEPKNYPSSYHEILTGEANILSEDRRSTIHTYVIKADTETTILDRTYFFPGWKVFIDGIETEIQFQDPAYAGLIIFNVPEGLSTVKVEFHQSKLQYISNIISTLSLASIVIGTFLRSAIDRLVTRLLD